MTKLFLSHVAEELKSPCAHGKELLSHMRKKLNLFAKKPVYTWEGRENMRTVEQILELMQNRKAGDAPMTLEPGDFELLRKAGYEAQQKKFFPIIKKYANAGNWKKFSDQVKAVYEVMPLAFKFFYKDMPKEYRRDFVIGCYEHHGDSIPACRKAIRELPKNGINEIPEEYRKLEYITIFRAGEEPIEKVQYRISWTLDKEVAEFFLNEYTYRHAQALYEGKIKPADIIAYTNERNEKEILQYRKVYDVKIIKHTTEG